jgi:hypothetical protein
MTRTTRDILAELQSELASIPWRPRSRSGTPRKRVTQLRPAEVDAVAAPLVARWRADGLTRREIARRLNDSGPAPVSGFWTERSIEALLRRMKAVAIPTHTAEDNP